MKKLIPFLFSLLVLCAFTAKAQQYFITGGTTSNIFPFNSTSSNCVQWLYYPSNFNSPSGTITTIYFRPSTTYTSTYTNLTIKMGHTNLTTFTTGAFNTGLTTVFSAPTHTLAATSNTWLAITLQLPFTYNNGQNLIVEASQTAYTGTGFSLNQEGTLGGRRLYGNIVTGTGTANTGLADFGFDIITCQPPTGVNAGNITVTGATMGWNAISGSLGYEVKVDQVASSPTGAGMFNVNNSYNITGLSLNTTYWFHVRNICSNGYSPWVNYSFTTLNAYCLPPTNILFSNIQNTGVDLLWSLMPTSDWYEYLVNQVRDEPVWGDPTTATPSISAPISGLTPGEKYYAHLRSFCLGGSDSSYWKVDSFVTKLYCGAPELAVSGIGTSNISATWAAVPDAVAYEYVVNSVDADPAFGQEIKATSVSNISLPDDGKNKYLYVRTKCNSQFSFSQWSKETLRMAPDNINEQLAHMPVSIHPNPATDVLILTVPGNAQNGTIVVTDMAGRLLKKMTATGTQNYIDVKDLSAGVYMVKYAHGGLASQSLFQKR